MSNSIAADVILDTLGQLYPEQVEKAKLANDPEYRRKAKMPDLAAEIRKAGSAQEVADLINSAWITYGATDVQGQEDGSYTFSIDGQKFDTFDGAMQYLWFKPQKSDPSLYKMSGLKYDVVAVDQDDSIEVTVKPSGQG